jgi:hypothetical protein
VNARSTYEKPSARGATGSSERALRNRANETMDRMRDAEDFITHRFLNVAQ